MLTVLISTTPFLNCVAFKNRALSRVCVCVCFCVQSEEDILLREPLEKLAEEQENFSLWYTVDRPTEGEYECCLALVVVGYPKPFSWFLTYSVSSFRLAIQLWVCECRHDFRTPSFPWA